jgi:hypothetical protein
MYVYVRAHTNVYGYFMGPAYRTVHAHVSRRRGDGGVRIVPTRIVLTFILLYAYDAHTFKDRRRVMAFQTDINPVSAQRLRTYVIYRNIIMCTARVQNDRRTSVQHNMIYIYIYISYQYRRRSRHAEIKTSLYRRRVQIYDVPGVDEIVRITFAESVYVR